MGDKEARLDSMLKLRRAFLSQCMCILHEYMFLVGVCAYVCVCVYACVCMYVCVCTLLKIKG